MRSVAILFPAQANRVRLKGSFTREKLLFDVLMPA